MTRVSRCLHGIYLIFTEYARGQNAAERGQSQSHAEWISVEGLSCSLFEFYTIRWLMSLRLRRMSSEMTRIWGKRADVFLDVCMEFIAKMRSGYIESFKGLRRSSTEIHGVYDL